MINLLQVIQCGRHNDIFKFWLAWRAKGSLGFESQMNRCRSWQLECTAVMLVSRLLELTQYQLRRMRELGPRFHLLHPGGDPEMVNICFWWINLI